MADVDAVVIGAGVVGLAIARALSMQGLSTIVLEKEREFGTGTSSRNSEVIHAGLYYPAGSLKARLCIKGKELLYSFCESHGVSHQRCGKLIVASEEHEIASLEALLKKGFTNGCQDLVVLSEHEAKALEPELSCVAALHSPSTGIIDSHGLMLALLGDAEDHGCQVAYRAEFLSAEKHGDEFKLEVGGDEPMELTCSYLINSSGHFAPDIARAICGGGSAELPKTYLAKGNYFSLIGKMPFKHLIYPAPHEHGLGVHLTLDMAGRARFGPDIEWVDNLNYSVDPLRCETFYDAIRRYWPDLADQSLSPSYSGIRPKISGPNDPAADFRIDGPSAHQITGLVNLFGIESPGLTASLAIADEVMSILRTQG
jgi:L-2-hydroxyglutarate oxidase LhgO